MIDHWPPGAYSITFFEAMWFEGSSGVPLGKLSTIVTGIMKTFLWYSCVYVKIYFYLQTLPFRYTWVHIYRHLQSAYLSFPKYSIFIQNVSLSTVYAQYFKIFFIKLVEISLGCWSNISEVPEKSHSALRNWPDLVFLQANCHH